MNTRNAMRFNRPAATALLAWLLPVFAWAPLTSPGYFEFHSGFLPIFNLADLAQRLADVSWAPTVGQPYDLLRGERALPYLLAAAPRLSGVTSVTAVKLVLGLSMIAGALGMFGWARRRLGAWPALVAAAAYVYWPLGLATVHVRGALAEAVLLGLLPFVLWAADAAASGRRAGAAGLALGLAAALCTQVGLALWLAAIVLGYLLAAGSLETPGRRSSPGGPSCRVMRGQPAWDGDREPRRALWAVVGWAAGLALGVIGVLPAALQHGWRGSTYVDFAEHFVYPHQLLLAGGGAGVSVAGPDDTLTFSIGIVTFALAVLSFCRPGNPSVVVLRRQRRWAWGAALALIALSTTAAAPVWRALPFLARTLTYPWQLLLLAGPWLAWLAGAGSSALLDGEPAAQRERRAAPLCAGLIALALLSVYSAPAALGPALPTEAEAVQVVAASGGQLLHPATTDAPADAPLAIFGRDEIALVSVEPAGAPGPGGRVVLRVRWQALRPLAQDYTVFVHALGPDGVRYGQVDTMPQANRFPTGRWRPGQVVLDAYELVLAPDAPIGGGYRYLLGFYTLQTGERLTTGADDKVTVTP